MTVNLIPRSADALDRAVEREQLSSTDVMNHAVVLYDWVTREMADGNDLVIRKPDGETLLVRLL